MQQADRGCHVSCRETFCAEPGLRACGHFNMHCRDIAGGSLGNWGLAVWSRPTLNPCGMFLVWSGPELSCLLGVVSF